MRHDGSGDDRPIRLMVQADDFGMCHAVNTGIVEAFEAGVLTQAMAMTPCPWFPEAAALARKHAIPLGLHCTLTSEWENLRWGPLTDAPSLVEADGTFHRTIETARQKVEVKEVVRELLAQGERLATEGLPAIYIDSHMGLVVESAYADVCRIFDRPFLYPLFDPSLALTSFAILSEVPANEKTQWLIAHLDRLEPGTHLVQTHPASPSHELRSVTRPDAPNAPWAESFRVSDLAALVDPEVRAVTMRRGIELMTAADAPRYDASANSASRCHFTMA